MIYLHLLLKHESTVHVCKDTSHMGAMGYGKWGFGGVSTSGVWDDTDSG